MRTRTALSWYLLAVLASCGPDDQVSERDARREKIRTHAKSKQKELSRVAGEYLGTFSGADRFSQDVFLTLLVKDEVQTPEDGVDSVRVPRLSGFLKLPYASSKDAFTNVTFAVANGEFDAKLGRVTLDLANSQSGSLTLELERTKAGFEGSWIAKENSLSGNVSLREHRQGDSAGLAKTRGVPLAGTFGGFLSRDRVNQYHNAKLALRTQKAGNDSISLAADLFVIFGPIQSSEAIVYSLRDAKFNPFSGALAMTTQDKALSLNGILRKGVFRGRWSSSYSDTGGEAYFALGEFPSPEDDSATEEPKLSGRYLGKLQHRDDASVSFPENVMLDLSLREDLGSSERASIEGSIRLYVGSYSSQEYTEAQIEQISFNPISRQLSIRTSGPFKILISGVLSDETIVASISAASKGYFADVRLSKDAPIDAAVNLQGSYQALFANAAEKTYRVGELQILTRYDNGLKVSGSLKVILGNRSSEEYLTYRFNDIGFNFEDSVLAISDDVSEISIRARYRNGEIIGKWFAKSLGELGRVHFSKEGTFQIPPDFRADTRISGEYKGRIRNTNSQISLPERSLLTLVASRDLGRPNGIRISGKLRLYLGSFGSHEYREYSLTQIRHNFFTREFRAVAHEIGISINGKIFNGRVSAALSHHGYGDVGTLEARVD